MRFNHVCIRVIQIVRLVALSVIAGAALARIAGAASMLIGYGDIGMDAGGFPAGSPVELDLPLYDAPNEDTLPGGERHAAVSTVGRRLRPAGRRWYELER
jgi:hypothetical protein